MQRIQRMLYFFRRALREVTAYHASVSENEVEL